MRRLFSAAVLMILSAPTVTAAESPRRVVSTNLCADQLLLALKPEAAISVSYLAADAALSVMADKVGALPLNANEAENIALLKPDLILAGLSRPYSAPRILAKAGVRVEEIGWTSSLAEARQLILHVAGILDVPQRGMALAEELDAKLAQARTEAARRPALRALIWRPNGYTSGAGGLSDEILRLAGLTNLGAEAGIAGGGVLPVEKLIALRPDMLVIDEATDQPASRAEQLLFHPALAALDPAPQRLPVPTRLWICAGPWLGDAALLLARRAPHP